MPNHTRYPYFDCLHSLSDLHLSTAPSSFDLPCRLAGAILYVTRRIGKTCQHGQRHALVLNGDFIDFPGCEGSGFFNRHQAVEILDKVISSRQNGLVFNALARYIRSDRPQPSTLVIIAGNHDPELCLPTVQKRLRDEIAGDDPGARGRIRFVTDGAGFRCRVGGCNVLLMHGNEVDKHNTVDYEGLRMACYDLTHDRMFSDTVTPSLGTMLVVRIINTLKKKYPFVDMVKPEIDDNLPLLNAVCDDLRSEFRHVLAILRSRLPVQPPDTEHPWNMLESGYARPVLPVMNQGGADLLRDVFLEYLDAENESSEDELFEDIVDEELGLGPWIRFISDRMLANILLPYVTVYSRPDSRESRIETARKRLADKKLKKQRQETHNLESKDAIIRALEASPSLVGSDIHFLVAGHTHLRRCHAFGRAQWYYNTGSWTPVVRLPDQIIDDKQIFSLLVNEIRNNKNYLKTFSGAWHINEKGIDKQIEQLIYCHPSMVCLESLASQGHGTGCRAVLCDIYQHGRVREIAGTRQEVYP